MDNPIYCVIRSWNWFCWNSIERSNRIGLITWFSSVIAFVTLFVVIRENRKKEQFEKKMRYYDENVYATVIPIESQILVQKDEIYYLWKLHYCFLKVFSNDLGKNRVYEIYVVHQDAVNWPMTWIPLHNEKVVHRSQMDDGWEFIEKKYPKGFLTKMSCINSALKRFNAKIIF